MIVLPRLGGTSSQVGLHDVTNVFRSPKAMRRTRGPYAPTSGGVGKKKGSRSPGKVQLEPLSSTSPPSSRKNESPDLDKLGGPFVMETPSPRVRGRMSKRDTGEQLSYEITCDSQRVRQRNVPTSASVSSLDGDMNSPYVFDEDNHFAQFGAGGVVVHHAMAKTAYDFGDLATPSPERGGFGASKELLFSLEPETPTTLEQGSDSSPGSASSPEADSCELRTPGFLKRETPPTQVLRSSSEGNVLGHLTNAPTRDTALYYREPCFRKVQRRRRRKKRSHLFLFNPNLDPVIEDAPETVSSEVSASGESPMWTPDTSPETLAGECSVGRRDDFSRIVRNLTVTLAAEADDAGDSTEATTSGSKAQHGSPGGVAAKKFTAETPEMPRGKHRRRINASRSVSGRSSQRAARTDEGAVAFAAEAPQSVDDSECEQRSTPTPTSRTTPSRSRRCTIPECRRSAEKEMLVNVGRTPERMPDTFRRRAPQAASTAARVWTTSESCQNTKAHSANKGSLSADATSSPTEPSEPFHDASLKPPMMDKRFRGGRRLKSAPRHRKSAGGASGSAATSMGALPPLEPRRRRPMRPGGDVSVH
uniref:Uncharacterized protein n=1 Tax=Phaeomonas parva TaxID=124430 RepID=A0A7S1TTM3_9STRA|mmetsp:Transcript_1645/g.4607  ORF Transcript_1645/g.4607 Transcript_1645/m.4607 type:complete len:590 (+) Transcript_1645:308-2077(+)